MRDATAGQGTGVVTAIDFILAAQALASAVMCGVIWFVQVVHYPLFAHVPAGGDYPRENQRRTAWVVIPPMLLEAVTALALAVRPPAAVGAAAAWIGLALVIALWLSTVAVQMPLHRRLDDEGHAADTVAALVRGNWLRTVLWTTRAALAIWMLRVAA